MFSRFQKILSRTYKDWLLSWNVLYLLSIQDVDHDSFHSVVVSSANESTPPLPPPPHTRPRDPLPMLTCMLLAPWPDSCSLVDSCAFHPPCSLIPTLYLNVDILNHCWFPYIVGIPVLHSFFHVDACFWPLKCFVISWFILCFDVAANTSGSDPLRGRRDRSPWEGRRRWAVAPSDRSDDMDNYRPWGVGQGSNNYMLETIDSRAHWHTFHPASC